MGEHMTLKKTDKIIAVVGVVILIVAVIGFIFYVDTEDTVNDKIEEVDNDVSVEWIEYSEETTINGYAGKKSPYKDPIVITLDEDSVLTSIEVSLTWKDDYSKGLIFNKGQDILDASVGLTGEEAQSINSKGSCNRSFGSAFVINDIPDDTIVEDVEDIFEAEEIILDEYSGMNTATLDVKVTVDPGERLLSLRIVKLLNFFRDKGNSFDLVVSYTYYKPDFKGFEETDDGDNYDETPDTSYDGSFGRYLRDVSSGRNI